MANFTDFDVEITDLKNSTPEHFNGSVATAGSPVTITPSTGNVIMYFFIDVPSVRDPVAPNALTDAIMYSLDAGTTYQYLMSGESVFLPGNIASLRINTNANGTTYRIIVWS